jgi:hypothetical protein
MAATPLAVSEQSGLDLERISEISPETITAALRVLETRERPIISPNTLRSVLAPTVGADVAGILVRQLLSLGLLSTRKGQDIDEIVESLTLGLRKKWDSDRKEYLAKWSKLKSKFAELLRSHHVLCAAKAFDLSYDFEHILHSARIITDIRPVFNIEKTEIIGTIICNRLRLVYHDNDAQKSISIAISEDDLQALVEECEKARTKIDLARRFPEANQKIESMEAFVSGEGNG